VLAREWAEEDSTVKGNLGDDDDEEEDDKVGGGGGGCDGSDGGSPQRSQQQTSPPRFGEPELDLPPPRGQTFDEAEALEALRDLPQGLFSAEEQVSFLQLPFYFIF